MTTDLQQKAGARFAEALAAAGARDPRDYYRKQLMDLKGSNPEGYAEAVAYYQQKLVTSIAKEDVDPIEAWQSYGLLIARLTAPGRPVAVDSTGRSRPFSPPGDTGDMILHVPDSKKARPLLVGLPPKPSSPQMATYNWLVLGRRALGG